jgi:hypothetical protein
MSDWTESIEVSLDKGTVEVDVEGEVAYGHRTETFHYTLTPDEAEEMAEVLMEAVTVARLEPEAVVYEDDLLKAIGRLPKWDTSR